MGSSRSLLAASLGLVLCTGCGPKLVRETIYESENVRVELHRSTQDGSPVPRGYAHPVTIADVRIAHILASLTHQDSSGRQRPTIRSEHIYQLAEGLARALEKAGPADELGAAAFPVDRRYFIFDRERVTAFRAFFEGDDLVLDFYSIEDVLDREDPGGSKYTIPVKPRVWKPGFQLIAGEAQTLRGPRTLVIDWRNPAYARPTVLHSRGGQTLRRTILMEEPSEAESAAPQIPPRPTELEDAQIRALDEIEAARRAGLITESEFRRRHRLVLEGRLEEAGYGTKPRE
jgi:hypothetical protein